MTADIDLSHGCEGGGGNAGGLIAVQEKASSSCCSATLAEGGTDQGGHTCTRCGKPCLRKMTAPVAHWTCICGEQRQQLVTLARARS